MTNPDRPALLFDLDGTLVTSDPVHVAVFAELFAERGLHMSEEMFMTRIHGHANEAIFAEFFPEEDGAALADEKEARFRARLGGHVPPMPGIGALLDRAQAAGWACAVVTNAPAENARAMLAATGLAPRLPVVVLGEDCARGKPAPDPYLKAMRQLGVRADRCIAFEDSATGIAAAVAAGAYTVGLRSSHDTDAMRAMGAHASISDFEDPALPAILARLEGETPQ